MTLPATAPVSGKREESAPGGFRTDPKWSTEKTWIRIYYTLQPTAGTPCTCIYPDLIQSNFTQSDRAVLPTALGLAPPSFQVLINDKIY